MNKEKIENFLYFLTLWFCTSVIVLGVVGLIFKIILKIK